MAVSRYAKSAPYLTIRCDACVTTIAVHAGDIPTGTLHKIERDLEPCLGKGWLRT